MKLALALAATLVVGCSSAQQLVGVTQLLAQCDSFKGKPIQLVGYLDECAGYECHLFADKAARDGFAVAWNAQHQELIKGPDGDRAKFRAAWDYIDAHWGIGIGGVHAFDRKAKPFQYSYVVITGRVAKDTCDGKGGTDRSAGIEPTDIRAWTPSEGAPANTQ